MADQFDQASETEALSISSALAAQAKRAAAAIPLAATGECQNPLCGEPLDPPRLFCGSRCAAEHSKRRK
jgi:hypothetical protein